MKKRNELFKPVNLTKGSVWKAIAGFSVITSKHSRQKNIGAIRRSPATQIVLSFIIGVILTAVSILSINPLPIGRKNQRGGYPLRKRLSLLRLIFILSPRRIVCAPQFFTRHRKIAVSAGCGGGRTDREPFYACCFPRCFCSERLNIFSRQSKISARTCNVF